MAKAIPKETKGENSMKQFILILALCSSLFAQDYKISGYIDKLNEYSEQMGNYKVQLTDYRTRIIDLPSTTRNDLEYSISGDLHNIADRAGMYTFAVTILLMIYQEISVDENKESAANIMSIYINLAIDSTDPAININITIKILVGSDNIVIPVTNIIYSIDIIYTI